MSGSNNNNNNNNTSEDSQKSLASPHIFFRSKSSVEICGLEGEDRKSRVLASGYSAFHVFHPEGSNVLVHLPSKGILKCDLASEKAVEDVFLENSTRIQYCMYSPKGTYILSWERAASNNGDEVKNLKIWNGSTGEYLYGFALKNLKREQWPPIQWTHDEAFAFHLVTNHLHVYKGKHVFLQTHESVRYERKIRCEGIGSFSLPKAVTPTATATATATEGHEEANYLLTTFVPETKGKPAKLALLRFPDALGTASNSKIPVASKSFYQAEECKAMWSPKGDAALVLTSTTVDSSGDSYYGSSNLYLITAAGDAEPVPLPGNNNNGPVHDVAWMPDGNKPSSFAMISGRMPALGSLHHGGTAQPLFLFGNAHRNTIVWSPHGRFVTLAGFGNLAGGMDFWDRNKCKKMPQYINATDKPTFGNTANCAVGYGWAPNSRYFMVSTTSPRMNVDNGVKVFKYNGLQLANLPWDNNKYAPDQLLAAEFVPTPHTVFPDRPQTPPPRRPKAGETTDETTAKSNTDANNNNNNNTTENNHAFVPNNNGNNNNASTPTAFVRPAGRYVPPAARRAGSTSLAERMRREREGNTMGPTKVTTKPGMTSPSNHHHNNRHKRVPVGMSAPTTTTTTPGGENSGKSKNALRRERQRQAKQKAEAAASAENNNKKEEKDSDPEKRIKKLKKILKQIDDLKQRDAGTLNEDQRKKVASEQSILKELASLK